MFLICQYKIKYSKKSEDYEIEVNDKFVKFTGSFDDEYLL